MLIKGFSEIYIESTGCHSGTLIYSARFKLDGEVSGLFPYINAVVDSAIYYEKPLNIQFQKESK